MTRMLGLTSAVLLLLCGLALSQQAPAPSLPRLIRFTGSVPTQPGTAVGITFGLYKDEAGGAPLWQEVQNVTLDAGGHYTVLLGANSKDGVPAEHFASNEARWLGVQLEQEPEQSRVLLVSVPYALKAGDAETVGGHPLSDFVLSVADAPTGSSANGGSPKPKSPATSISAPAPLVATTINALAKFSDTAGSVANSQITDDGTNVRLNTAGSKLFFKTPSGNPPYFSGNLDNQLDVLGAPGGTRWLSNDGTRANMVLLDNGNIGVGTGSPQFKLDVVGNAGVYGNLKFTASNGQLQFNTPLGNPPYFSGNLDSQLDVRGAINGTRWLNNAATMANMVLLDNGNMGVGIGAPAAKLDVNGNLIVRSGGVTFPDLTTQTTALPGGCSVNQIPKWNGTAWTCQADVTGTGTGGGTVTSIIAGNGLTGGTITTTGTLALDTTFTDARYLQLGGAPALSGNNTFTGQNTYAFVPTGAAVGQGSMFINPPSAPASSTLLGLAVGGTQKARITAEGDFNGRMGVFGGSVSAAVQATGSSTGLTFGVLSTTTSTAGTAVRGESNASSGQTFGIHGINASDGGIGVLGFNNNVAGTGTPIGVKGASQGSTGIGVLAQNLSLSGSTVGLQAEVNSSSGTAGVFNNSAGGKILSGRNNGVEKFSVDGSGNLNVAGTITGTLSGTIGSSNLSGTYSNAVTFSNAGNSFTGNGAGLTNVTASGLAAGTYANALTFNNASNAFTGSGAGLTNVNAASVAGTQTSALLTRAITYIGGCDSCSVLATADSQNNFFYNVIGAMTLQSITCFTDAGSGTIINVQRDNGTANNILTANLTCTTAGATSSGFAISALAMNDKLNFVIATADGLAHRITLAIKTTVN